MPLLNFNRRSNQEIQRKGNIDRITNFNGSIVNVAALHQNKQIDIGMSRRFSICMRAKQHDVQRLELAGDLIGKLLNLPHRNHDADYTPFRFTESRRRSRLPVEAS